MRFAIPTLASRLLCRFSTTNTAKSRPASTPRARFALETFEPRDVPTALTWSPQFGSTDFYTPQNWVLSGTTAVASFAPVVGDDVTFDGSVSSAPCTDMGVLRNVNSPGGGGDTFAVPARPMDRTTADSSPVLTGLSSLSFINSYSGTVTFTADVQAVNFTMSAGSTGGLSQPGTNGGTCDLTVTGDFNWTSGILNSTPSDASVYSMGGGAITLPGAGQSLICGSTLVFSSLTGSPLTTISGAGTLLFNCASDDAAAVRGNAQVQLNVDTKEENIDGLNKKLNLESGSWTYTGTGTRPLALQVLNTGGLFKLSGSCTINATGGTVGTSFSYVKSDSTDARLHIETGCTLKVSNGAQINGGSVYIIVTGSGAAILDGKMEIDAGDILFSIPYVNATTYYGRFEVTDNVNWNGGTYRPTIDSNSGKASILFVDKILNIDSNNMSKPTISPNYSGATAPFGTWPLIGGPLGGKTNITGDKPLIPQGWFLDTVSNSDGTNIAFQIRNNKS